MASRELCEQLMRLWSSLPVRGQFDRLMTGETMRGNPWALGTRCLAFLAPFVVANLASTLAVAQSSKYELARATHPGLFQIYYDEGVMEYCGLLTSETRSGSVMGREALLADSPLSESALRDVRIAAAIAVNAEYENRGLSGQRNWCRTEGLDAFHRSLDLFYAHAYSRHSD